MIFDNFFGPDRSEREKYLKSHNEELKKQLRECRKSKKFDNPEELKSFLMGRHIEGDYEDIEDLQQVVSRMIRIGKDSDNQ